MKKFVFYALLIISIAFYAFLLSGLMGLTGNHGIGKDGGVHVVHHAGASLVVLFVLSGLASQFYKFGRKIAGMHQVLATMLGLIIMAFIVGDPDNYGGNKGIFDLAFLIVIIPALFILLLHPDKKKMLNFDFKNVSKPLFVLFSTLLIPFFIYGIQQSLMQRNSFPPLSDIHHSHWHTMGTVAFATILTGLVGSLRTTGHFLPQATSSISLVILGTLSVLNPTLPSSFGTLLGLSALIGGLIASWFTYRDYKNSRSTH